MLLVVVEDRQADAALQRVLASARARTDSVVVLTADALLMMQLRRDGVDARLPLHAFVGAGDTDDRSGATAATAGSTIDDGDRMAFAGVAAAAGAYATFDGIDYGAYIEYTLAPSFVRAVRNVAALEQLLASVLPERVVTVGGGALVQAARLVATNRSILLERVDGDVVTRILHAIARVRGARKTRWVNTEFRALVLEPGFLWLLFVKGFWRWIAGRPVGATRRDALIVVGDRFTADVVDQLRGDAQLILAGATQPGRVLFDRMPSLTPIESFAGWNDIVRTLATFVDALSRSLSLAFDRDHARRFVVADVCYWPLVRRTVALHIPVWVPLLRHLAVLAERAAGAAPQARLLMSADVTAYSRVLVDALRRVQIPSTGIQHGITAEANGHSTVHVDTLATWGEQTEEWYRFEGAKRGREQTARFVVTGNPRYDALAARGISSHMAGPGATTAPVNSEPAFTVCVCTGFLTDFSTGASEYENLLMIETVLEWAHRYADVRVVHKIHPGEEAEYYVDAARVLGWDRSKMTMVREPILHDVLDESRVLVSQYSSTVLESIALGTPVVVFDAVARRRLVKTPAHPLDGVPGVSVACSVADTGSLLDAIRNGPPPDRARLRRSKELRAFLFDLDGRAAARVAALVRD